MSNRTITSANAIFTLTVPGVFPIPVTLEGFATDDAFATDAVDFAETMIGVDGKMSAGYVPAITPMTISLQADSPSADLFDTWLQAQKAQKELFRCAGNITLLSTGKTYILTNGALKKIKQVPDAKKVLQPVQYGIDWEQVLPAPIV